MQRTLDDARPGDTGAGELLATVWDRTQQYDWAASDYDEFWQRLSDAPWARSQAPQSRLRCAVFGLLLRAVAFDDAATYLDLHRMVGLFGHLRLAREGAHIDIALEAGPRLRLTTASLLALVRWRHITELVGEMDQELATAVAESCRKTAYRLLVADLSADEAVGPVTTADDLRRVLKDGDARLWRAHLAAIRAQPWGPHTRQLLDAAQASGLTTISEAILYTVKEEQGRAEATEKEVVAQEIRDLVAESGLTQSEFASCVGTSASRLSTYVNGTVTPSAAMLMRIRKASQAIAERGSTSWSEGPAWEDTQPIPGALTVFERVARDDGDQPSG